MAEVVAFLLFFAWVVLGSSFHSGEEPASRSNPDKKSNSDESQRGREPALETERELCPKHR